MPKYRLCASIGWIANSKISFGIEDCYDEHDAQEYAYELASEQLDVWVEEINEEAKD